MTIRVLAVVAVSVAVAVPCGTSFAADGGQAPLQLYSDVIEFVNKDKMHGNLAGIGPGQFGVKWENDVFDKPVAFTLARVARIQLGKRQQASSDAGMKAVVKLTNNDQIRGALISLDANNLTLDTSFAGKMTVARKMLRSISPNQSGGSSIYEGPTDVASWTIGQGGTQKSWVFRDDALVSIGRFPIGRFLDSLPEAFDIQFDVAWVGGYPQFNFMFLVDNLQYPNNGGYSLVTSSSSIYLNRYNRSRGSSSSGDNAYVERFSSGRVTKASYRVLVSGEAKTIVLMIDGQVVKQWSEGDGLSGAGKGISFYPQSGGVFKISNIRVTAWDGKIPSAGGAGSGGQKEDMIKITNNDKVSGTVKSISGDMVKFEASYATMDVPLSRVVDIQFSTERSEKANQNKDDVRATFTNGGTMTIQLGKLELGKLDGKSDNFGPVSLPLSAFRTLEFNLYQKQDAETKPSGDEVNLDDFFVE